MKLPLASRRRPASNSRLPPARAAVATLTPIKLTLILPSVVTLARIAGVGGVIFWLAPTLTAIVLTFMPLTISRPPLTDSSGTSRCVRDVGGNVRASFDDIGEQAVHVDGFGGELAEDLELHLGLVIAVLAKDGEIRAVLAKQRLDAVIQQADSESRGGGDGGGDRAAGRNSSGQGDHFERPLPNLARRSPRLIETRKRDIERQAVAVAGGDDRAVRVFEPQSTGPAVVTSPRERTETVNRPMR